LDGYSVRPTHTLDIGEASAADAGDLSKFVDFVLELHRLLRRESDLSPGNPTVSRWISLFRQNLRGSHRPEDVQFVLENRRIRPIRRELLAMLSEAEGLEELYEARRLLEQEGNGNELLSRLPGWNVYECLAGKEMECFDTLKRPGSSPAEPILFVGSGPLPLSAIVMHLRGRTEMTCLDLDPAACEVSESLLRRLGLGGKITVLQVDGADYDYRQFRRILVASLVPNKSAVLDRIRSTAPGAIVGVRTAEGMRGLMYEAVDEARLSARGWGILARTTRRENLVMNSTIFIAPQ